MLKIALAEVGYIEKKSNKSLDSKTANKGSANYTKYNRDMKKIRGAGTVNDYWCANFVSWCFYKAYGKSTGKSLMLGYSNYVPTIYLSLIHIFLQTEENYFVLNNSSNRRIIPHT